MKLSISLENSYVILSPGRTGSMIVSTCIGNMYQRVCQKTPTWFHPASPLKNILPGEVWHYHNIDIINNLHPDTQLIISTRLPINSALSYIRAEMIGVYHLDLLDERSIPKYYIDKKRLLEKLAYISEWYKQLKLAGIKQRKHFVIDYSQFENDVGNIFNILNLGTMPAGNLFITKPMPGRIDEWFENWKEIKNIIRSLDNRKINELYELIAHSYV